jgi:hypothetical protein
MSGLQLFQNMRVPKSSIIYQAFRSLRPGNGIERGGDWVTSGGSHLRDVKVFISAIPVKDRIYCLMSS